MSHLRILLCFLKGIAPVIEQELESGRIKRKLASDEVIDRSFINIPGAK